MRFVIKDKDNKELLSWELDCDQVEEVYTLLGKNLKKLSDIKIGDTFKVAGMEFIKFTEEHGKATVVAKDFVFKSEFGDDCNFAESVILKRLEEEVLPKVIAAVGEEKVCCHNVDLTALDGHSDFSPIECKISIPTVDFYREHVAIFDQYNPEEWWYLVTPFASKKHGHARSVCYVRSDGTLGWCGCGCGGGVRPFLVLDSSIFVSE